MWLGLLAAFFIGFILHGLLAALFRKPSRLRRPKKVSIDTFSKLIVSLTVFHGMILTTFSYALSYVGMDPVVDVSSTIVREIVAPVLVYLATNMIMNIFEKNKLAFSVPINTTFVGRDGREHTYSGITDTIDDNAVG